MPGTRRGSSRLRPAPVQDQVEELLLAADVALSAPGTTPRWVARRACAAPPTLRRRSWPGPRRRRAHGSGCGGGAMFVCSSRSRNVWTTWSCHWSRPQDQLHRRASATIRRGYVRSLVTDADRRRTGSRSGTEPDGNLNLTALTRLLDVVARSRGGLLPRRLGRVGAAAPGRPSACSPSAAPPRQPPLEERPAPQLPDEIVTGSRLSHPGRTYLRFRGPLPAA
jgi:hypothetical protein